VHFPKLAKQLENLLFFTFLIHYVMMHAVILFFLNHQQLQQSVIVIWVKIILPVYQHSSDEAGFRRA
jgi:hypothetical protein